MLKVQDVPVMPFPGQDRFKISDIMIYKLSLGFQYPVDFTWLIDMLKVQGMPIVSFPSQNRYKISDIML